MTTNSIPGFEDALDIAANSKIMLIGISGQIMAGLAPAALHESVAPEKVADIAVKYAKALITRLSQEE